MEKDKFDFEAFESNANARMKLVDSWIPKDYCVKAKETSKIELFPTKQVKGLRVGPKDTKSKKKATQNIKEEEELILPVKRRKKATNFLEKYLG